MTGPLTLPGAPTANLHASSKQYVDSLVTAAALLAKLLTVDGAGSGLDSDLLDGQNGAWYADIRARLGFAPVQQGTGVGQTPENSVKIGWAGAGGLKATIDATDQGRFVFDKDFTGGSTWHRFPSGLILQWGFGEFPNQATSIVTFPLTFPNAAGIALCSMGDVLTFTQNRKVAGMSILSTSQAKLTISTPDAGTTGTTWLALGS